MDKQPPEVSHFCAYFIGSKVHRLLIAELSRLGIRQRVLIPIRRRSHRGANANPDLKATLHYVHCLSVATRFLFSLKVILYLAWALLILGWRKQHNGVVHAHTLYTDGIAAFLYARITGAKLVLTVRNTDIHYGIKWLPQYHWLLHRALRYASRIVFLSKPHMRSFENHFSTAYADKSLFIANAIAPPFVAAAQRSKTRICQHPHQFLFVGQINTNKNIERAIRAAAKACQNRDWRFHIVGGDYTQYQQYYPPLPPALRQKVNFVGPVTAVSELMRWYDQADVFIMPSHHETFGLVYLEAISRCLPVVYNRGQGIDGLFAEGEVGFCCNARSITSIARAISANLEKFPQGLGPYHKPNPACQYSWPKTAKRYRDQVY